MPKQQRLKPSLAVMLIVAVTSLAPAAVADLDISNATIRQLIPGQDTTAGYFDAHNRSDADIELTRVYSEVARTIEVHKVIQDGDMVRMRRQPSVVIPAGATLRFQPGGWHLMLFGINHRLPASVPITFTTASGTNIEVPFNLTSHLTSGADGS